MKRATLKVPPRLMTAEQFDIRYGTSEERVELVDGVIVETEMPGNEHGEIAMKAGIFVGSHILSKGLGRIMGNDSFIRLGPKTVRGPDVHYISYQRLPKKLKTPKGVMTQVPELVFEVISPSQRWKAVTKKVGEYLSAGVVAVVVLEPSQRSAHIYRLNELPQVIDNGDDFTVPDILPGFSVPVKSFFG